MRIAGRGRRPVPPEPLGRLVRPGRGGRAGSRTTPRPGPSPGPPPSRPRCQRRGRGRGRRPARSRLAVDAAQVAARRANPDASGGGYEVTNRISVALHLARGAFTEAEGSSASWQRARRHRPRHTRERADGAGPPRRAVPRATRGGRRCWVPRGLGGDSDTVAAMAGAVSGALTGLLGVPRRRRSTSRPPRERPRPRSAAPATSSPSGTPAA